MDPSRDKNSVGPASTVARGFEVPITNPRFEGPLEAEFRRAYLDQNILRARVSTAIYLALVFVISAINLRGGLVFSREALGVIFAIRVGVLGPALLLILATTYIPFLRANYQTIVCGAAIALGLGIMMITATASTLALAQFAQLSDVLVIVYGCLFLGLLFRFVVTVAVVLVAAFLITALALGIPTSNLLLPGVVLAGTALMAVVSAGRLESLARTTFLEARCRQKADRVLRESEAKYRAIVESAHEGILVLDTEAKITYANPQMAEILGYEPGELIGRTTFEFTDDVGREEIARRLEQRREDQTALYDFRYMHRDGSDIWVLIAATPLTNKDGEFTGSLLMVADVTERRKLERQLRQVQKMEAVGQLTGGIAHDFNNLLTIMIGNLELLEDAVKNDETLHAFVQEAVEAGFRGAELIKRLLAFSRQQLLAPEITDINGLVTRIEPQLNRALGEEITLEVELGEDLGCVAIDPGRMESSLMNLVVNARDAMLDGGRLTITTANTTLDESHAASHAGKTTPGDYVMVTVSDAGTGIPKEVMEKIFDPFFSTKKFGEGSGLGLSMVYGFVRQSKGHIVVESEEGSGTIVNLYLPQSSSAAEETEALLAV